MGEYKNLKIELEEDKLDTLHIVLIVFLTIFTLFSVYLADENEKLLKQVGEIEGEYNRVNSEYEILNRAYENLNSEYEYAVDIIRTSDRYQSSEGVDK